MTSVETADIKALGSSSSGWSTLHHIFKVKGYFGPLKTSVEHNVVTENLKKKTTYFWEKEKAIHVVEVTMKHFLVF